MTSFFFIISYFKKMCYNKFMDPRRQEKWYYRMAIFFVANQVVFKRLGVVLLILFNIAVWWPTSVKLIDYFTSTRLYNLMLVEMVNNPVDFRAIKEKNKAQDLQVISVDKIRVNNNSYDLVAKVHNPNLNWTAAQVDYAFMVDGRLEDWQSDFILPGQNKFLFKFFYNSTRQLSEIDLKINQVTWQKVRDQQKIDTLNKMIISQQEFDSQQNFSQLSFDVDNQTSFGFWLVGWQVVLYTGNQPSAVNYVSATDFLVNEQRTISASWNENLPFPSTIEIIPDLDVFDQTNYILESDIPTVNLIKGAKTKR